MLEVNKIYNCDFREIIDELPQINLVATDPPYNIGFKYNEYADAMSDEDYTNMIAELQKFPTAIIHYPEEMMKYIVPALGIPNEVCAWCYNSNLPKQFRLINFYDCNVDFNKVKQPYKNPNDKRVKKLIENGSKGTRSYDWFSDIQIVKNVSKEKTGHPCPVPVKLMERIILLTTNEGDTIMDPFMGSGTTAIAALNTKRNYIGFEIDKTYYDITLNRIEEWNINNRHLGHNLVQNQ